MKFLVFALCVCAASAASFGSNYKPFKSFPSIQQPTRAFAQAVVSPQSVVSAAYAGPKVAYETAKIVATAPVVAAKTVYTAGKEANAAILRSESTVDDQGFQYNYETDNGIFSQSSGILKKLGDKAYVVIQGSYHYTGPDGEPVEVTYVADENGFQPVSKSIPVAPPVPEEIQRSLAYIAAHPQKSDY